MDNGHKLKAVALACGLALGVCATTASALTTITISEPNSAIASFPGPYAQVQYSLSGNTATFTFTSLTTGGFTYLMGDGGSADLNINGSYTLGPVSATSLPGFNTPTFVGNNPGQVDGFGTFSLSLDFFDGYTNAANSITFSITGSWADEASVLTPNNQGAVAAIHAFVCTAPCTAGAGALATGFAANGGSTNLPEPGALGLAGMVLAVVGLTTRRREKR